MTQFPQKLGSCPQITGQRSRQPLVVSLDAGTIDSTQAQHSAQWLTVGAPRIQNNLFSSKFRLSIKSVRMNQKDNFSLDLNLFSPYFVPSNLKFKINNLKLQKFLPIFLTSYLLIFLFFYCTLEPMSVVNG
jgi:hypothetical protein